MITIDGLTHAGEVLLRPALLAFSVIALVVGLLAEWGCFAHGQVSADLAWAFGTIPVLLLLAASIIRDLLIGRIGVDPIALLSMSAALALGQSLAAVIMVLHFNLTQAIEITHCVSPNFKHKSTVPSSSNTTKPPSPIDGPNPPTKSSLPSNVSARKPTRPYVANFRFT